MQTLHTFFKKEIFAEVAIPNKPSRKVVIICSGAPGVPSKQALMEFFVKKGYWVFHVRYRGSWESKGVFLKKPLDQDLIDVIDELPRGFTDLWTKKKFKIIPKKIVLIGSSFGGPAVILASRDPRVSKVIAISPVVDWRRDGKAERMRDWIPFMQKAYGMVYRAPHKNWDKLLGGAFYNPAAHAKRIDGSKLFLIHAKDDDVAPFRPVKQFALQTGAALHILKRGGHLRSSLIMKPSIWKKVKKSFSSLKRLSGF